MVNYLYQIMQDTSSLDQVNIIHTLQSYVSYSHIIVHIHTVFGHIVENRHIQTATPSMKLMLRLIIT